MSSTAAARARRMNLLGLACCLVVTCIFLFLGTRELPASAYLQASLFNLTPMKAALEVGIAAAECKERDELLRETRSRLEGVTLMAPRLTTASMAVTSEVSIPVKGGVTIPARVYHPDSQALAQGHRLPVLVWFHGGGWVLGSVRESEAIAMDLAATTGMVVMSVGYRLAPEHPYPTPVNDAVAAVKWAVKNIERFGGDKANIAVGGESAGGNLALVAAAEARRSWWRQLLSFSLRKSALCAVVAATPVTSHEHAVRASDSYNKYKSGYILSLSMMRSFWDLYLGKENNGKNWRASPLRAPARILKKMPPTLFVAASHDVLGDEINDMNARLESLKIPTKLITLAGTLHGFFGKEAFATAGLESLQETANFLKEHCSLPEASPASLVVY